MKFENNYPDLRVRRTRKSLKDALIELLQEIEIEKITVNTLAKRANINRVTFYSHYKDIPDMLEKLAQDMIDQISKDLEDKTSYKDDSHNTNWQPMINLLEHISSQAVFYKVILGTRGVPLFKNRLIEFLINRIVSQIGERREGSFITKTGVEEEVLAWYDSSAIIGTIIAWLNNDMPYTPRFLVAQFSIIHNRTI
ncbi:TetR/AcrR family transcriptional regulator [Alkalicoccobacillus plakortidis]|uniref:TetR/AcrR family transcriptional regulator C-terminal domain-containing protein n=1 Tax=Alkalicoccobacillus plakortidis TaxID=444060 RepID=A0ABT0XNG8_9BACI|nr:TetR/AcrR family transcriptional regulator C-terminal domain-containing protein [Alkalicoccobacillus plakortidis]MCM2677453.1 TetR/AcrR family transcriptional regulator C-terminal domain-containing protein [Alkalicoccobacillus plakortidis]